jgi:hypothetical protein
LKPIFPAQLTGNQLLHLRTEAWLAESYPCNIYGIPLDATNKVGQRESSLRVIVWTKRSQPPLVWASADQY